MRLIKECWQSGDNKWCMIRTDTYANGYTYIQSLIREARADYPLLSDNKIAIRVYGGDRARGMMGIEFPVQYFSDQYTEAKQPENTLN